jgi:nicotinamidase-related amidase
VTEPWLVAIDFQRVFGDPTSPWCAPRYAAAVREFPWALQRPESALYELTDEVAPRASTVVTATTFGKWTADLRAHVGDEPRLVVAGVATDCCVISTVLAAADAGASVTVVGDACAGSTDDNHAKALEVMALYGPLVSLATTDEVLAAR